MRVSVVVFACGDGGVKSGGMMSVEAVVRVSAVVFACGGGGVAVGFFPPQRNDVLFLETSPRIATFYLLQPCLRSEDRDIRCRRAAKSHGRKQRPTSHRPEVKVSSKSVEGVNTDKEE